ncbi:GDSL esterase/lipase At1g71250 [Hevea brasiliensis]|uniref:GDSL esterase/lipase At1g71250 n=1 Tax=Hevea brasiliensis TaxID=3981 RepID=UPI0025D957B5|nr:GDSL esterase/lipase At1g71250 [Hevea brasiliensis]
MVLLFLLAFLMSVTCSCSVSHGLIIPEKYSLMRNGSAHVSALYVMGDSSVDCGDSTPLYPYIHRNLSLLPCNGSDRTLLPYLLAEKMGLRNISPFYGQNGSIEGIRRSLNYGSAHATIMKPGSLSHQSLNQQLRQVFETFQFLQLQLSEETAQHFIRSSMFYLSFGRDDYVDLFLRNSSGVMLKYSGPEYARILVNQMVLAVKSLYDANVRNIICMGILPLGCTPRMVWEWHNVTTIDARRGCVEEINELVLQYNIILDEHIMELKTELSDAQIIFCDVYQGIMEIMTNPLQYGFEDVNNACCGLGLHGAIIGCLSADMACNQPSAYVWWDLYNPSRAVNSFLAEAIWSGHTFPGICRPILVQDLVYSPVVHLT